MVSLLNRLRGVLADIATVWSISRPAQTSSPSMALPSGGWVLGQAPAGRSAALAPLERGAGTAAAAASCGSLHPASRQRWASASRWQHPARSLLTTAASRGPGQPSAAADLHTAAEVAPLESEQELAGAALAPLPQQPSALPAAAPYRLDPGIERWMGGLPAPPPPAPAAAAASAAVSVEGTVQRITFRAEDTGYTVLRLTLAADEASSSSSSSSSGGGSSSKRRRKEVVTVVGTLPRVAVGQTLLLRGTWVQHPQYGQQLRATDLEELPASGEEELVAYLGGGAIPGVGRVTARRMVDTWGESIESKLNRRDAVRFLTECKIGLAKAEKIKAAWDASKGTREGVRFLKEHGVPLPLAQRVAERHGVHTVARVQQDPYAALAGAGLPFSKVDLLATKVGAPPDLVSRAAMALQHCLGAAAAEEGHTFLPWHRLEKDGRRLLQAVGLQHGAPWHHAGDLHVVAQLMHSSGVLVAEPPPAAAGRQAAAADEASCEVQQALAPPPPHPIRAHPTFESMAELRHYLNSHLPGIPLSTVDALLSEHGEGAVAVLDMEAVEAARELCKCRKVGPKTADKMKLAWEAAHGNVAAATDADGLRGAGGGPSGLTMADLLAARPAVAFPWGPATRCYSPHLHAAEQCVAQRSLQRAGGYREPTSRRLSKIRRWLEGNQAVTDVQLSEGQVRAIEVASDAPLMVVTGGPGCGKTTAVQTIVKLWCAQGKVVRIAAPTGRAAQRMGEIQGIEPCTIHRLLGYQPRRSGDLDADAASEEAGLGTHGAFKYNKSNPLPADAVLVDEASMLSLPLAAALVDALKPKCQLVLVGDVDQLPPVGPGAVLQGLIASKLVPVVDLREVFRQAAQSAIVTSALAVRRGDVPLLQRVDATVAGLETATSDALLVGAGRPGGLSAAVKATVCAMRAAHGYLSGDEEADLQVISPMRKGPAGTAALNPMLQALLNPPRSGKAELPRHAGAAHAAAAPTAATSSSDDGGSGGGGAEPAKVFRVGDRVVQQVNDYDKEVFNGDQGWVHSCDPGSRQLVVHYPHLGPPREGGGLRTYQGVELGQLELAYAITVHKAQGGEAQHVVLALSPQHGRMLTRRLLYTGLTRAKRQLVVVAASEAGPHGDPLKRAVDRKECEARLTSLQSRLEAGRLDAGLAALELQSFSNEEQTLAQARIWQQAAVEQAAEQRAAARLAGAEHGGDAGGAHVDWAAGGEGMDAVQRASQVLAPSPAHEALVAQYLEEQHGLQGADAEQLAASLCRSSPHTLATWDARRAEAAAAWAREKLGGELTLPVLLRRAPMLAELDPAQLERAMRFVQQRAAAAPEASSGSSSDASAQLDGREDGGSSRSVVGNIRHLLALRMVAAAGGQQAAQQAGDG